MSRIKYEYFDKYENEYVLKTLPHFGFNIVYDGISFRHKVIDQELYDKYILDRHNKILEEFKDES